MKILLDTVSAVQEFCVLANNYKFDIDVSSGRYIVDAKSLMGLFSLNLSNAVEVSVSDNTDEEGKAEFFEQLRKWGT